MNARILVSLALVVIAGCATTAVPLDQAKPGKVAPNEWQSPTPGSGTLTIVRDTGMQGAACTSHVLINGKPVADLRIAQTATVYLPPGEYIAGVRNATICGGGDSSVSVTMTAGARKAYRVGISVAGDLKIEPAAL